MRAKGVLSLALVLGLLVSASHAEVLYLAWDMDIPKTRPVTAWTLLLIHAYNEDVQQGTATLTPLPDATCRSVPGLGVAAETTWCAVLACPPPGAYSVVLQAEDSLPSNVVTFGVRQQTPCVTTTYEAMLPAPVSPRPTAPPPTAPPGLQPPGAPFVVPPALDPSLTALEHQFTELARAYQTALGGVRAAYTTALAEAQRSGDFARLWQAYRAAQAEQDTIYARFQELWQELFAEYERRILALAQADDTPPWLLTGTGTAR